MSVEDLRALAAITSRACGPHISIAVNQQTWTSGDLKLGTAAWIKMDRSLPISSKERERSRANQGCGGGGAWLR